MSPRKTEEPSKIVMLAPVALVLIVYSFLVHMPQQTKLQAVQDRYDKLVAGQHDVEHELQDAQMAIARTKRELRKIEPELADLRLHESELLTSRNRLRMQATAPSWPAATMQRVTSLMERHRLDVLESQPETAANGQAEKVIQPLVDLLVDTRPNTQNKIELDGREIYRLKVRGRFQDLQSALNSLSRQLKQVLPLSLQMEVLELESKEIRQPERVWTLTILV